jgi:PAS domain S-box-containing protein
MGSSASGSGHSDDGDSRHSAASHDPLISGQLAALELAISGAALPAVLDVLARAVEAASSSNLLASILILDSETGRLRVGAAPQLPVGYNEAVDRLAIEARSETDPRWPELKDLASSYGLVACSSMPIVSSRADSQGALLGAFAVYCRTSNVLTPRDQDIVARLCQTAALVIERENESRRRAAAEAQLRAERDRLIARVARLFENAPAAIAVMRGPEHTFELANPTYLALVGGRPLAGKTAREVFPELAGQGYFEVLDTVYRTGQPYVGREVEVIVAPAGSTAPEARFFDFVYQPISGAEGAIESILVVAFEVTDLVTAKREAEAARHHAEHSEQNLRTFIDNLPELAWTALPDGHIDYYNRRWYEYTGTTFEEMQGWGWEKVHDPSLLPAVAQRWKQSLATGQPFEMEFTLKGADGVPRWFLTRVSPMRDASDTIVRWFGTNTDIHEIKSAQALSIAVAEQSRETERMLLQMRAAKEKAEKRVAELEALARPGAP